MSRLAGHLVGDEAEASFQEGIEVVLRQQAKSWELRAMTTCDGLAPWGAFSPTFDRHHDRSPFEPIGGQE